MEIPYWGATEFAMYGAFLMLAMPILIMWYLLERSDTGPMIRRLWAGKSENAPSITHGLTLDRLPVWKTITLGQHKSPSEYRKAIEASGMRLGPGVKELFEHHGFTCADEVGRVDLVLLTAAQLGFTKSNKEVGYDNAPQLVQIYRKARDLGLALCPAEVGPALRLVFRHQQPFTSINIAMNPFTNAGKSPASFSRHKKRWVKYGPPIAYFPYRLVFSLWVDDGGASLSSTNVDPDLRCKPEEQFVFLKPREQQKLFGPTEGEVRAFKEHEDRIIRETQNWAG